MAGDLKSEIEQLVAEAKAFWPDPTEMPWPDVDRIDVDNYLTTEERAYISIQETALDHDRVIAAAVYGRGLVGRLAFALNKAGERIAALEEAEGKPGD